MQVAPVSRDGQDPLRGMTFAARRKRRAGMSCALAMLAFAMPLPAGAKVRINGLADVNFGALANLEMDAVQSQSFCLYSQNSRYSIRADGSGSGGAFRLAGAAAELSYEVRWNEQGGATNGTALSPGVALSGLVSNAQNQNCTGSGPATSASLILVLPATSLTSAMEGSYSGTLTLIVAEE